MALMTRVSRLFRADMHAVLDRIEEPEALLRQSIREMEDALGRDEQQLRLMQQEYNTLQTRGRELEQALGGIEEELDLCFESGEEALARKLVRRKLETERLYQQLQRKEDTLAQRIKTLQQRVKEHHAQLESLRQKAEILAGEGVTAEAGEYWAGTQGTVSPVNDDEVDVAFLREKQRRTRS